MAGPILLVLCALACGCLGAPPTPYGYHMKVGVPRALELMNYEATHTRIIGGTQVKSPTTIPHQAGIVARLTTGYQSICGGSLISNTRVVTAAHCWWDGLSQANRFTIVLGSTTIFTGGTRIDTTDVVVHPQWNVNNIVNDVMMVKIKRVNYNNNIQAIPLPNNADINLSFAGMTATVSGFGKTSDKPVSQTNSLYQRSVSIITNADCQKSFKGVNLHGSHLCTSGAGKVGTCDGDSGGPLTTLVKNTRTLVGIVSFGLDESCASGNPSVYTRVTAFLTWIRANM